MKFTYQVIYFLIAAWLIPFCLHVAIQTSTGIYIKNRSNEIEKENIRRPPYGAGITLIAAILSLIPTTATFLVINLIYDKIPGSSPLIKGILFSILRLCINGDLVRAPLMNTIIGNPLRIAILKQFDIWIPNLVMCVVLSFLAASKDY
jgi:hypothetical protein